jgi:hypothetical protein
MRRAAASLQPVPRRGNASTITLHLLSGRRFWEQTVFCVHSFARNVACDVVPIIYDDGSLESEYRDLLASALPLAEFVPQAQTIDRLDEFLPTAHYPRLRERWTNYPNIRKLLDVHVGSAGWKLVLDSDLLFFRAPEFLIEWLRRPEVPLHAVDFETSYGYSPLRMERLAGASVSPLVNVGLTGLNSDSLDWERLEYWCDQLISAEGTHYYLEQALVAMLVAGRPCAVAPRADYVTLPVMPEALQCRAVMHHYVADSKRWYFRHNWRMIAEADGS